MSGKIIHNGIYRVSIKKDDDSIEKIIVGNNYKKWWQHALEYIYVNYKNPENGWRYLDIKDRLVCVEYCDNEFYDDRGLKWCKESAYQDIINRVHVEYKSKYIPQYKQFEFNVSSADEKILIKKLMEY